jgi:hypothetical protein
MNNTQKLGAIIGAVGVALVVWKAGGIAAIGMLLAMWGNNIERSARGEGVQQ